MAGQSVSDFLAANAAKGNQKSAAPTAKNGGGGAILAAARALHSAPVEAPVEAPKDWWEQTTEQLGKVAQTPVIKQILDTLATPIYAVDNTISNVQNRMYDAQNKGDARAAAKGEEGAGDLGNRVQTMWEGLNPGSAVMDILGGVGKGLSAGIGGNHNDVKTGADIVRQAQDFSHAKDPANYGDSSGTPEKWIQGLGGLAGDVLLDPSGAIASAAHVGQGLQAVKGAVRGAGEFGGAAAVARKTGQTLEETHPGIENTRWQNAKAQAKVNVESYKLDKLAEQQAKDTRKATKKMDDGQKADYLLGNIETLHPAVRSATAKGIAPEVLLDKIQNLTPERAAEVSGKLHEGDPVVPVDLPPEPIHIEDEETPANPVVGLSQFKKPTEAEAIFNKLSDLRTVDKKPVYDKSVVKNVNEAIAARPFTLKKVTKPEAVREAMTDTNKVPDFNATIAKVRAFDKEMGGNTSFPMAVSMAKQAEGKVKKTPIPVESLVDTFKDAKDNPEAAMHFFDQLDPELKAHTGPALKQMPPRIEIVPNPKALTDQELQNLGVDAAHVTAIKQGTNIQDITNDLSTGEIRKITRDISNGTIPQKVVDQFYEHAGSNDRKKVATYLNALTSPKNAVWQDARKQMEPYGSVRTGATPNPSVGVSGHNLLSQPMPAKGFTVEDNLAALTKASPEEARAFLEAKYTEKANNLAALTVGGKPIGVELRSIADQLFAGTISEQARPAGPLRALDGASIKADLSGAKYETKFNTQSTIWRLDATIKYARQLEKDGRLASRYQMDDVIMAVLHDVDARLRLAGFDQHLSNMQIVGDKLVVRLSPSDALGVLTKTDRVNYIWGNKAYTKGETINEFLPTTILDVAETLVRSATKLKADGTVDVKNLMSNALYTLQGKYSEIASGKRVIINNLDSRTLWKNNKEILNALDKDLNGKGNFAKQFGEAKTPAMQQAVVDSARTLHPDLFDAINKKRMNNITNDLMMRFLKGFKAGEDHASPLAELINTNMRNAAVEGGNVAKPISEALAQHSANVLETLNSGTLGDHLSALVARPPFSTTDKVAKEIITTGKEAIQHSVATGEELNHAQALERNVANADKAADGAKNNTAAYQKNDLMVQENAKPLDQVNPDKVFDLAQRELNKDILFRMYGTSRFFNKRTGMPISFDVVESSAHATEALMTGFHGILRDIRRSGYTTEQLRTAFNELKEHGAHDQLTTELNAVLTTLFDPSRVNFLTRNSVGPKHFNEVMKSMKFDERYMIDENLTPKEMTNVWKKWDVTDPIDFFSKMMGAMTKTATDVSMGASFSKHFGKATAEPGYVRLVDKSGENPFIGLIDQTLYYPKELAPEMVHLGRLVTESRSFTPGTKLHTFVTKVMDPVISNLKMTQTTLKPGHHVMSIIGDGWRNHSALSTIGINGAAQFKLYNESARILYANVGDIEELSNFQKLQRLQGLTKDISVGDQTSAINELKIAKQQHSGTEYYGNIAGGGQISRKDIYAIMQARGIALPAHLGGMAEDYLTDFSEMNAGGKSASRVVNAVSKVTEGMDRLANPIHAKFGMKNPYSLNKFTANRDTWTRGVLFLGAMRSRNFKTLDDAVEFASNFTKKWSPTAKDLGAGESKYLRRAIFYYTWVRGMVPRMIESAMMHPGVAITPYKGAYALATANGLDPQSFGDPFPPDSLLPSWYSQRVIGPQYSVDNQLWGANPTGPLGDLLNQFGSDVSPSDFTNGAAIGKVSGTFLNMSTPWAKAPLELITGKTLQGGIPIDDKTQYVQDMVGPARFASRAIGKEVVPEFGPNGLALPNRTEKKFANGMTPEQTGQNALPEILNYLTGLGFTNYSTEGTAKSAQFQQKDALVQAKKQAARFK